MGDFTPDRLDSRSLETPWEWENRVLLEEYYIFDVVIPPGVEREQSYGGNASFPDSLGVQRFTSLTFSK